MPRQALPLLSKILRIRCREYITSCVSLLECMHLFKHGDNQLGRNPVSRCFEYVEAEFVCARLCKLCLSFIILGTQPRMTLNYRICREPSSRFSAFAIRTLNCSSKNYLGVYPVHSDAWINILNTFCNIDQGFYL